MTDDDLVAALRERCNYHEAQREHHDAEAVRYAGALTSLLLGPGTTIIDDVPELEPRSKPATERSAKRVPTTRTKRRRGNPLDIDWAEVATVANDAPAGTAAVSVAAHFGINEEAAKARIKLARKHGHTITLARANRYTAAKATPIPRPEPKLPEPGLGPIGHLPVNEQSARDGAAGPRMTIPPHQVLGLASPRQPKPEPKEPAVGFTVNDARAHLDSARDPAGAR